MPPFAKPSRSAGGPAFAVEILHIKIADQKLWGRMNEVVKLDRRCAGTQGINVGANVYPYTRGNNNLASIIPPWAHEGGTARCSARLKDPAERAKIKKDVQDGIPGWYNHYTAIGGDWSRMLISGGGTFSGLTMDRVLAGRVKDQQAGTGQETDMLLDEFLDFLAEQGGSVTTVYDHHTEKDMNLAMMQPWCSIGSDGLALAIEGPTREGHAHPRSFGTFPRILGVYVREKGLLRLEDAVRKMTSQNAIKLGLYDRGILRPGTWRRRDGLRPGADHRQGDVQRSIPVQRRRRIRDRERAARAGSRPAHRCPPGPSAAAPMINDVAHASGEPSPVRGRVWASCHDQQSRPVGRLSGAGATHKTRPHTGLGSPVISFDVGARQMTRIFVYGTLKRGQLRHFYLAGEGAVFVAEARTAPSYVLYQPPQGDYPCMVEDRAEGAAIEGELWDVPDACLQMLDEIEGHPDLFRRQTIQLADAQPCRHI